MSALDDYREQVKGVLRTTLFPFVPPLPNNWDAEQHDRNRLSRALAAFVLASTADIALENSAHCLTDGGDDNGIDAVYFDKARKRLYLVQSKSGGAPDLGECQKFATGISDLLAMKFENFNTAFDRMLPDIEDALGTADTRVVAFVTHMGEAVGPHAKKHLDTLAAHVNQHADQLEWMDVGVAALHQRLTAQTAKPPLTVTLTLEQWSGTSAPRRAFYGRVSAKDLAALYQQQGKALLEANIRHYLGAYPVNKQIVDSAREHSQDFFYLNNGLTAIGSSVCLIRFRGHVPKGGYDVPHVSKQQWPAPPPAVL